MDAEPPCGLGIGQPRQQAEMVEPCQREHCRHQGELGRQHAEIGQHVMAFSAEKDRGRVQRPGQQQHGNRDHAPFREKADRLAQLRGFARKQGRQQHKAADPEACGQKMQRIGDHADGGELRRARLGGMAGDGKQRQGRAGRQRDKCIARAAQYQRQQQEQERGTQKKDVAEQRGEGRQPQRRGIGHGGGIARHLRRRESEPENRRRQCRECRPGAKRGKPRQRKSRQPRMQHGPQCAHAEQQHQACFMQPADGREGGDHGRTVKLKRPSRRCVSWPTECQSTR